MRGKSELVQTGDAAKQTSSGLDRDYITNWSYGIGETWTLLVPNFKGGSSSAPLSQSEAAMEKANPMYGSLYNSLPQYFGSQPWTAGPRLCGCIRTVPLRAGLLYRKRPAEMGVAGSNLLLHRSGMGQELHAADGLLHRLRPDVQQVPRRIIHPRHSGIHHSPAGNLLP